MAPDGGSRSAMWARMASERAWPTVWLTAYSRKSDRTSTRPQIVIDFEQAMGFLDRFRRTTRRHDSTTTTVLPGAWGNAISGLGVSGIDPTRSLSYGAGRIPSAQTI